MKNAYRSPTNQTDASEFIPGVERLGLKEKELRGENDD